MSSFPKAQKRARGGVRGALLEKAPRLDEESTTATDDVGREDTESYQEEDAGEWCRMASLPALASEPCVLTQQSPAEIETGPAHAVPAWARWPGTQRSAQVGNGKLRDDVDHWAPLPGAAFERICIEFRDLGEESDEAASTYDDGDAEDALEWEDCFGSDVEVVKGYRADVGAGYNLPPCDPEVVEDTDPPLKDSETEGDEEERGLRRQLAAGNPLVWGASADPSAKATHIVFVVHGIGGTFHGLQKNLADLRSNLLAMQKYWFWHTSINVHVEMIDWKSILSEAQTSIFNRITPSEARSTRMSLNETLGDVLFYKTAHHRSKIQEIVKQKMNVRLRMLRADPSERFRDAGVSIIGHSLGSVIAYDVLFGDCFSSSEGGQGTEQAHGLDFKVDNFFLWGSPLAAFVSIAGEDHDKISFAMPQGMNMYNIFHPHDPVAFRLDPLLQVAAEVAQPETVPYYANNGVRPSKQWTQGYEYAKGLAHQKWTSFKSKAWEAVGTVGSADDLRVEWDTYLQGERTQEWGSGTARMDFILQEDAVEAFSESYGMLQSHFCYWSSHDVALLILKKISQQDTAEINADERDQRAAAKAARRGPGEAGPDEEAAAAEGPFALLQGGLATGSSLVGHFSDMPCFSRRGGDDEF